MRFAAALLLAAAAAGQPVAYTVSVNFVEFRGSEGSAELEWRERPQTRSPRTGTAIPFRVTEQGTRVLLEPRYLTVDINFKTSATYIYDVGATRTDRMRIVLGESEVAEQYFYYGPTPQGDPRAAITRTGRNTSRQET